MRRSCPSSVLLALLVLGTAAALAPSQAEARTRDTLTGVGQTFATTQNCRGHKIEATVDTIIEDFTISLQNTSAQTLKWYVYESAALAGTYDRIAENQSTGTAGAALTAQSSGPVFANVTAGNYYILTVCWVATTSITMGFNNSVVPSDPSWGEWTTGTFHNNGSPAKSQSWFNSSARPDMVVYTSAGSSISAGEVGASSNFANSLVRGNAYEVTKDTRLTEVRQYVQGLTGSGSWGIGSFSVPWYIYRRAGTCSSGQTFTQVASTTTSVVGGQNAQVTSWAVWNPNLLMEAGYCYFIGIDFTQSGVAVNQTYWEAGSGQESDWGENKGYSTISTSGTPAASAAVSVTAAYQVLQRIGAVRDTESSDTATGTFTGVAGSEFGNIFSVTTPTHISEMAVQVDPAYAGVINLAIYESATQSGAAYTRIWSSEVEHDDTGKIWHTSQAVGVDLDPGALGGTGYYLFVAELEGGGVLYRDTVLSPAADFGPHVGAHWSNSTPVGLDATKNISFQARHYDWKIVSCDDCVDIDGDGFELSEDCDDNDAARNPSATETCNGVDDDCDGALLAGGESDNDADGQRICAGDCDDTNPLSYLGASEICDGSDNDCNGTTPTAELDDDGDGYISCAFAIAPNGTGLFGGGDCDDSDPNQSPGLAFETCDGDDSNCDGYNWIVSTAEPGGSFFSAANAFVGNVFEATAETTLSGIQAELIISATNQLSFAAYVGPTSNGPWTQLASTTMTATGSTGGPQWFGPGPGAFSDPIIPGMFYLLGVHWAGTVQYGATVQGSFPYPAAFGDQLGVVGELSPTLPPVITGNVNTTSSASIRIFTDSELDGDGDSYLQCAECDDGESTVYPTAPELCDGLDNDCDGVVPSTEGDSDQDASLDCADCDDNNSNTYPGATELCDGQDNDCNGSVPSTENDLDNDAQRVCGGDCDDGDALVGAGFSEVCDGNDSNCDGAIPASEVDGDGDFYIDCALVAGANLPAGLNGGSDCNDAAANVYPGAPELCDGSTVDNNCNGTANDEGADVDGDGTNTCTDCDDADANVFPGGSEICDGKDSDCSGGSGGIPVNEQDVDGDGYIQCTLAVSANPPAFVAGGDDCLINDADSYPGAVELCDGIDNDCDGTLPVNEQDVDNDGVSACDGDCDDADNTTYPGGTEICDGVDNNCNGSVPANEADNDSDGQRVCGGDCNDGNASIYTGNTESCDALDNDCNGVTDEGFDSDSDNFFDGADPGCVAAYSLVDCDDGVASIYPGAIETCDGVDQDCDGLVDDGFDGDGDTYLDGSVAGCVSTYGAANVDCDDGAASIYPGATEVCDGIDQNCDAAIDDGFDADGDTYFDDNDAGCLSTYGASADCDDATASTNPGATESCNGVDDDCNTVVDNGFDVDADGYF
ncbi:MAG: putative metal-binding motif-containing protein, partial [Deltaproteobacteria bacterium]|nr:putative metal-binding motif-containing protein [Deltaproteobacteria bacterium]